MKRSVFSKLILVLVIGLAVVSCKKDDDSSAVGNDITGVWACTAVDYTGTTVTEAMGQSITADYIGEGYDIEFTLTITEDPNEVVSNGTYSVELTTTYMGQSNTQYVEHTPFTYVGTWIREGNTMTITSNGESTDGTIVNLTDSYLEMYIVDERVITSGMGTITSTTNMTVKFLK